MESLKVQKHLRIISRVFIELVEIERFDVVEIDFCQVKYIII
jgi:hypothetical protein